MGDVQAAHHLRVLCVSVVNLLCLTVASVRQKFCPPPPPPPPPAPAVRQKLPPPQPLPHCCATGEGRGNSFRQVLVEEAGDLREHLVVLGRERVAIIGGVRHAFVDLQLGLDTGLAQF